MLLPGPRGPVTAGVVAALRADDVDALPTAGDRSSWPADPLADDDLQLALWICYELYYRGFEDVADQWEWTPELIALRRDLETMVLDQLRREVLVPADDRPIAWQLRELIESDDGPPLSRFLQRRANRMQFREFVAHRSTYQLKEADPHTWAIPRLAGRPRRR
jgi:hypothetical protein